jgi:hypothetical protein
VPLPVFEVACVLVLLLALAAMARTRPLSDLLIDYGALAVAGFLGEETCVAFYEYYHYAEGWHLRIDRVPILVPLIWPLVILSAREVARAVWPGTERLRPLLVFAIVAFDASLVEVVAVRAGLWSWVEQGHLGVPIIGILGWGYFAIGADIALSGRVPYLGESRAKRALATIAVAPLVAHVIIQITWWGLFRYAQRTALGIASLVGLSAIGIVTLALVVSARRRGGAIPWDIAAPRLVAAGLFFVLLVMTAPRELPLWLHTAVVALPYFAATKLPFK